MRDLGLSDFTDTCETSRYVCAEEGETGPEQIESEAQIKQSWWHFWM